MPVEIKELIVRAIIEPMKKKAEENKVPACAQSPLEANVQGDQIRNLRQMIQDKNER